MKVQHSLLAIMLTCSMLVSCNQNEPNQEEMKQTAQELATFLSDNYQVGDSVFFETETGETEGFVVQVSEFFPMQISNEPDFGEEYKNQQRKDQELKDKVFGYEALTYEEFIKLMQISVNKFRQSFGAYDRDLEVVFREKTKQTVKKKKESEKTNNEK